MQKPTKKQATLLKFIDNYTTEKNHSPSYREIMAGLGLSSVSAVAEHIDNLIEKGVIQKNPGEARSLEILDYEHKETVELFKSRLEFAPDEDKEILLKAADILGLDLES